MFRKVQKVHGEKKVKKYQLFGMTLLRKEKSPSLYKIKLFDINFFSKTISETRKKYFAFGIKVFQKKRFIEKAYEQFAIPQKITFKKEENPLVSIIIPVYNQIEYTKQCLCSVLKYGHDVSYEIIIADDNSSDETRELASFAENITIVRNEKNLGYIKNCNNAAKYARGEYLYFLNNDTIVQEKWLSELLRVFELREDAGVVGSKIIRSNGTLQECGVYMYTDLTTAERQQDPSLDKYAYLKKADYVSGCSLLTPTWMFNKIGGFDEIFSPAYCDDPDYCFAVNKLGYSVYVQPKSVLIHFGSVSYQKKSNDLQIRNNKILREKWADIFAEKTTYAEEKLPFSGKLRPRTILVVDDWYPQFDKHAGGKTIFHFLKTFVAMGFSVKFCPRFVDKREEPYYSMLGDLGIEVIDACNVYQLLQKKSFIDYLFLSRPQVAETFIIKNIRNSGIKVFYYGHDIHHLRMQREAEITQIDNSNAIFEMKQIELAAVESSDTAFYPSSEEKKYYNRLTPSADVRVIPPYLYDVRTMPAHKRFLESSGALFVGSSHGPNLDGLLWFVNEIFPIIIEVIPNFVLHIVGSSTSKEVQALQSKNIIVHGFLSDEQLNELYSSSRVAIAPLRYGAGIKGKVIEALYHGIPVVTTSIGAEGIKNMPAILIADTAVDYARSLIEIYDNETRWNSFTPLYASYIEKEFSYENAIRIFSEVMDTSYTKNEFTGE